MYVINFCRWNNTQDHAGLALKVRLPLSCMNCGSVKLSSYKILVKVVKYVIVLTYGYITHHRVQLYTYSDICERIFYYKVGDKFYFIKHRLIHTGKTGTEYDLRQRIITDYQKWHKRDTRTPFSCMKCDNGIFFTISLSNCTTWDKGSLVIMFSCIR